MLTNRFKQSVISTGLAISLLTHAGFLWADNSITLVAGERAPYIGQALPDNGYVSELAREAFKRRGYRVKIEFYPWARAQVMAHEGAVDGLLPVTPEDGKSNAHFVYSNPFPGDAVGLLKKKSFAFSYPKEGRDKERILLNSLKGYRLGMVRGGANLPLIDDAKSVAKEMVSSDIQNLDKLDGDRIQFALIDKYTAADLMAGQRPHLIGQLEFMTPALAQRDFHIAFSTAKSNHRQLQTVFNEGLAELARDGTLLKIQEKHGLFPSKKTNPKKVQLIIGTVNNGDMQVMQEVAKEYERQHPNIQLEWRVLDENTLRLRLLSDLAISDGQFDVMTIGTYEAPIWAKQKWLMPLRLPASYEVNDLLPTVRSALSHQGQLFALPFYAESSMTFYRKDLFAKAGIKMPAAPSYDNIRAFASKIHNPAAGVYGICLRGKPGWGENMAFLGTLINAHGGRWFDQGWQPEIDSPAWEQAVTFYKDLLTQYGPPNPDRNGFNENLALFSEGKCGMWIDATVAAGMLFDPKRSKVSAHLGYVSAPTALTHKGAAWLWSWALAIPNSSKHKKEATEFISWATSKEYVRTVAESHGWLTVPPGTRKSTYENENYLKAAPFARFVLNAIESADTRDATLKPKPYIGIQYVGIPEFPAIGNQVGMEIAKTITGELSVKEALAKSQAKTMDQMKSSGYIKGRTQN